MSRLIVSSIALSVFLGAPGSAWAGSAHRRRFEPTDLEMEESGVVELDVQVGAARGDGAWRTFIPDFELDLGLTPEVELDIDGTNAVEGGADGRFSFDHFAPDNLWISSKIGLLDIRSDRTQTAWAIGMQLGPKLAIAPEAHGLGYEVLALLGRTVGPTHLALNVGGLVDPGERVSAGRPIGVESGLDVNHALARSPFSLLGEIGGIHYFSSNPDQLSASLGFAWQSTEAVELSVVGLVGLLAQGDRGAVLFGISPKFAAWK
jgi:hypothetical protein